MMQRSQRHHQIPIWLLKQFSWKDARSISCGSDSKDSFDVRPIPVKEALFRNNANTRTDYKSLRAGDPAR